MWLKPAIIIVFILLLISLFSGLLFLIKDQGGSKRTLSSLTIRVILTVVLLLLVSYGVLTGKLKSQAPWQQVAVEKSNR